MNTEAGVAQGSVDTRDTDHPGLTQTEQVLVIKNQASPGQIITSWTP